MRLHEFQSKRQLQKHNIPIALGEIAFTAEDVYEFAKNLNQPVVIKAQVLSNNRKNSSGIAHAKTPEDAKEIAHKMFSSRVQGFEVKQILVDPQLAIQSKIYLGITYDRTVGRPVLVASTDGGSAVEELALQEPGAVIRQYIKPILGLRSYQITSIASALELPRNLWEAFRHITHSLYECYTSSDALLAEINPLAITEDNELVALDATLIIDDNALYRQPELALMREPDDSHLSAELAYEQGLSYIKLEGQIGCIVNGAGLAMTTMDTINHYGGGSIRPANFLDIGGGATTEQVAAGLRLILRDKAVKSILLNIFGGITRCDEVARGIVDVYEALNPSIPIIIRLQGTNSSEGLRIINRAEIPNLLTARTLSEAAIKAIEATGQGHN